jgi:hypothetical protein
MPIIYRPDPIGDALANILTSRSERDARKHNEEVAERKRKQKLTALGVGVVAGGLGGIALAPALGLGGSALAGAAIPGLEASLAATTLTGTGALLGGLGGASIGSRFAGQIADDDIAGALGTAATTTAGIVQNLEDQRVYGYTPTREEKAALGKAAIEAGTTLGAWEKAARQGGGTVGEQAGLAKRAVEQRQVEMAGDIAYEETTRRHQSNQEAARKSNEFDWVPDHAKLADVELQKQWIIENSRPPPGGGEPALAPDETTTLMAEAVAKEDFLLSNRVRVPRKAATITVPGLGDFKEGEARIVGEEQWEVLRQPKTGTPYIQRTPIQPVWMIDPNPVTAEAGKQAWMAKQLGEINGQKFKVKVDTDGRYTLDEVKQDQDEAKGMSYKDARAATAKEMEEVYPDTDSSGVLNPQAGLKKPIDPEELHRRTLKLMEQSKQGAQPPPAAPQSQAPSSASPELDAISGELQTMMGNYGDYDQMPPELQVQFDALIQRAKALGGN